MGVTPESFQRRPPDHKGGDVLNKTLKPRHLHMIAIGGSIGAGFFVGSGSALNRGVSKSLLGEPLLFLLMDEKGPATLLIDFMIMGVMIFNVGTWRVGAVSLLACY
jgi:amino acid transporter